MTQDNNTEGIDTLDESTDDSPVIKALRQQVRDLEKQVKSAPTRESVEAELREELARQQAIADQLVGLGHPKGMSEILKGKLGEAEVTRESVAEALKSIGYEVEVEGAAEGSANVESESQSNLAKVTDLSAKVRSAATGEGPDAVTKINQVSSREELIALSQELGIAKTHY